MSISTAKTVDTTASRNRLLERRYVYLNPITSQVSSNTLTVRQLCRLLCPSTSSVVPSPIFTPQLQILGLEDEEDNNNDDEDDTTQEQQQQQHTPRYSPEGWTVVNDTPILREACAQYYYSSLQQPNQAASTVAADDETAVETTSVAPTTRVTEGPVSCRQLAHIVKEQFPLDAPSLRESLMVWSPLLDASHATHTTTTTTATNGTDAAEHELASNASHETSLGPNNTTTSGGWRKVDELPHLQAAMDAFDVLPMAPTDALAPATLTNDVESFDPAMMMFTTDEAITSSNNRTSGSKQAPTETEREMSIQEELEAFLKAPSTDVNGRQRGKEEDEDDEDENEGYESDGGTHYMKDQTTGEWVEGKLSRKPNNITKQTKAADALASKRSNSTAPAIANVVPPSADAISAQLQQHQQSKKRKRPKFSAKHAKCWIYVSGLPSDTNEDEVTRFFSKVGIIALDPERQQPKVKLYRYSQEDVNQTGDDASTASLPRVGQLKGDASICYARPESVDLAVQILDEALFRPLTSTSTSMESMTIHVERAKFEQHGETFDERRRRLATSRTKQKVVRLAALQAMDWDDEGDVNGRISGGRKGLRIIVLKHVFDPMKVRKHKSNNSHPSGDDDEEDEEEGWELQVERHVRETCEQFGPVEKITIFSKHPDGVVLVKFVQPSAATEAVQHYNNTYGSADEIHGNESWRSKRNQKVEASYWDGVTDYTVRDEVKEQQDMERRQDEFGNWLEHQELPEEFQLRVEEVNPNKAT